jgi:hypothetical protein
MNNYSEDLDFSFKKEITDAPVRESKLDLTNTIKIDTVTMNID